MSNALHASEIQEARAKLILDADLSPSPATEQKKT
jgi:hypothetical protein